MSRRVVVTGIGMVTPVGLDVKSSWSAIKAGKSGVAPITLFDASDYLVKIAAEVKGFDPTQYMPAKEVRRRDRYQLFVVAAAKQAVESSGIKLTDSNRHRVGTIIGSSVGGVGAYWEQAQLLI